MIILVIDGQGGGIGKTLIERLLPLLPQQTELVAVGTNSLATANMLKAGPIQAATGENAVVYNAARADLIFGTIGIIAANSMLGELSPEMAQAVAQSPAVKILIPLNKCNLQVAGAGEKSLPQSIDEAVALAKRYLN